MHGHRRLFPWLLAMSAGLASADDIDRRTVNNGNLVLEDIPEIPAEIVAGLNRYQNVRSGIFRAWSADGDGLFIMTRFGDVNALHFVSHPLGARRQLTFFDEPMGQIVRQPGQQRMLFMQDAGGSEFAQIFSLDPASGQAELLTDGKSRNGSLVWDRYGGRVAYLSTRRNGASNDVWIMDPDAPDDAEIVLESPDGSWWAPVEFSANGSRLLVQQYVSATHSSPWLVDLDSGEKSRLAGGPQNLSVNLAAALEEDGFWLITDQGDEFQRLAWQAFAPHAEPQIVTGSIPWNVSGVAVSEDRQRMAFVTNEDGRSGVYLLDPRSREFRAVDAVPTGVVGGLKFSPDGGRLAMTINTAQTPSDTYVLALGSSPLDAGTLTRWTDSEVGGLDTTRFVVPELVHYPTFDGREIPAWIRRPAGEGPHPVIVSIHGGPEGQSRPTFSSMYQLWAAELGAAVILPNVRGSTGYGKTWVGLDNGFRREDSVKDIGALLDWIDEQPDLDANRVALFGGSYGGYMVLAGAVHYSDRLRAAVDIVGISNFVTFLENTQDYRRDLRRVEYGDERDPAMREHLERISPLNNVEKIDVPMFVIQGENDPRVPVSEAVQMVEALRGEGRSVWYMNALNEGHGYKKRENSDVMQQAVMLFFQQFLIE